MGCTSSREIGNGDADAPVRAPNAGLASSSSQAIVNRAGSIQDASAASQQAPASARSTNARAIPDGRPNHALRAPAPVATCPSRMTHKPWTKAELERQRVAFFETRVNGSPDAWAALSLVCEFLRNGDITSAQGVQDAAGLNCPSGMLSTEKYTSRSGRTKKGGVYDDKGVLYDIPGWVVADPQDIVQEDADAEDSLNEKSGALLGDGIAESSIEEYEEADVGELVKVRARLSGGEPDVIVSIGIEQKVGVLMDLIKTKANVGRLRLAHMGRMLPENQKLSETGWAPGHVLNAFVFE